MKSNYCSFGAHELEFQHCNSDNDGHSGVSDMFAGWPAHVDTQCVPGILYIDKLFLW